MNKLTTYVLPNLWGCIKIRKNFGYMLLPVLYLFVILGIASEIPSNDVTESILAIKEMDSYNEIVITKDKDDKKAEILEKYDLTEEKFSILCAIVLAEAEYNSYEDAYAVINTIYNRTKSKSWVTSVNRKFGQGKGENLYYQAISPRQFTVYEHGSYKKYLGVTDVVGYDAIIDFLYTEEILHNYLSFRSNNIKIPGSVTFSAKGNNYFNEI